MTRSSFTFPGNRAKLFAHHDEGWRLLTNLPLLRQGGIHKSGMWPNYRQPTWGSASPLFEDRGGHGYGNDPS